MLFLILFSLLILFIFHQCYWRRRNLPPGPMPFPFVGNLPILDMKDIDNQLLRLKKKYGNVITLWLPKPTVIVGGAEELKAIFIKDGERVAGRPNAVAMEELSGGNCGLVLSRNKYWRSQKRFALHVLRDFGFGRPILENAIMNQASEFCDYFKGLKGEPVDLTKYLSTCVGNIINQLVFGSTEPFGSDTINDMLRKFNKISAVFNHPFSLLAETWKPLKHFRFLAGSYYHELLKSWFQEVKHFHKKIQEHRETIDFDAEPRDYIDAFLIEQRKHGSNSEEWSDMQLIQSSADLFIAGMDTTSDTLRMLVFYVLHYPEVQKKIHEELDRVVGKDKVISMSDQAKLPYLNACLQELQRLTTVLPMNIFHEVTDDLVFGGWTIPKGTTIVPQFESVHKDEKEFKDPKKFDPSRFLDDQNNYKKDERITPFSSESDHVLVKV